jgi:hypothetical protein
MTAYRAEIALDFNSILLSKLITKGAGDKVEGLFANRATFESIHWLALFESTLDVLYESRFSGTYRTKKKKYLTTLLASHGSRTEKAHDLLKRSLHAEELTGEIVKNFNFVTIKDLVATRICFIQSCNTLGNNLLIESFVCQRSDLGSAL